MLRKRHARPSSIQSDLLSELATMEIDSSNDDAILDFPEWSDQDIAAEKWTTKFPFEDPDGLCVLPGSIRKQCVGYKRPSELLGDQVPVIFSSWTQQSKMFTLAKISDDSVERTLGVNVIGEDDSLRRQSSFSQTPLPPTTTDSIANIEIKRPEASGTEAAPVAANEAFSTQPQQPPVLLNDTSSDAECERMPTLVEVSPMISENRHLLSSPLLTSILNHFHIIFESLKQKNGSNASGFIPGLSQVSVDEMPSWDLIYPRGKDNCSAYNPSGKYAVKLHWQSAWRKIIVDDRIPVDAAGKFLLVSSALPHELWPLLITKALLKLAMPRYLHR